MEPRTQVVVTDVRMRFGSMVGFIVKMVGFIVKWTIASIPAMIILLLIVGVAVFVLGGMFGGILGLGK